MGFNGSLIERVAVVSICVILIFFEWQFRIFSIASAVLSSKVPWSSHYMVAIGVGLWIGLSVYSLRRRHGLARQLVAHNNLRSDFELALITDKVTGLPNRQGLEAYLQNLAGETASGRDLVLIGICFANLKMIADVQGFEVADVVARNVTDRLLAYVRVPDLLACVNGQQFYILLADTTEILVDRSRFLIDTLVDGLRGIVLPNGTHLPLSLHIGTVTLSHCPKVPAQTLPAEMVRRCDLAAHEAALRSSGSVVAFDAAMETAIDRRAIIEASLDDAILNGRIEPYFQPLIDLARNRITGFEVLARWKHPKIGAIPPAVFIPIATEAGRLEDITILILNRACRASIGWPGDFKLAFNISPRSLNNETFMANFLSTLTSTEFDRHRIEVEITEDAFVKDASILSTAITSLKAEGITLAIDDFGTGYSSLRHLLIMPFDKIKIDQSFVKDMSSNPESRKIVEAIIGLGRSLGLLTVAEGIENEQDRLMLENLGCEIGQGYLFARPMPASEVMGFIGGDQSPNRDAHAPFEGAVASRQRSSSRLNPASVPASLAVA